MARNKRRTRKIVITDNRAVPKGYLLVPEKYDPPGAATPKERPVLLNEEEIAYVEAKFGPPDMTSHGVLSYYMDDDGPTGTTGIGVGPGSSSGGSSGPASSSNSASPHSSRGSAIGGSTSRASQSNIGGSQTGGSSSGSSSSHASSSNRSSSGGGSPSGSGGQNTGGQNTGGNRSGGQNTGGQNTGGRGNEAGGVGAQSGGSGAARSGSVAAGTRGGTTNPSGTLGGGRSPLGNAPNVGPSSSNPNTFGGVTSPSARSRAPGSAAGLLGAIKGPSKIQDRINPDKIQDRAPAEPLSQINTVTDPLGRPRSPAPLISRTVYNEPPDRRDQAIYEEPSYSEPMGSLDTIIGPAPPESSELFTDTRLREPESMQDYDALHMTPEEDAVFNGLLGGTPVEEPVFEDMPRRTFIDTKSNLVAMKPFQDRVPQDPNFNPATSNPDYSPSRMPSPFEGSAPEGTPLLGTEPGRFGNVAPALEEEPFQEATPYRPNPPFTRNSINSLLGAPTVKTVEDRVPQARYEPSDTTYLMDSAIGRHAVDIADARRAAVQEAEPSTRVPGSAAGLANYNPAFTPSTRVPGSAAGLANAPTFPGRSRVNPMLGQDTEPEPTDITQYGSWPKDLEPSSGMPQGTMRDRLIQDAQDPTQISPDLDTFPQDIRPNIQEPPGFIERVKTAIGLNDNTISDSTIQTAVDLYGPDALPTLQAVGAMFRAGRGRGGSASSLLRATRKAPPRRRPRPSAIPPDAPLLEA